MKRRIVVSLRIIGAIIAVVVLTGLLSWFMQYLCAVTISDQEFHLTSQPANRLTVITALVAVGLMVMIMILVLLDGCARLGLIACIMIGLGQLSSYAFSGTPVATQPAQVIYFIVVVLWSFLMWYIFLDRKAVNSSD
jgi:hypothetical protein